MPTPLGLARELYDAFAHADGPGLVALLHSDFRGHVSEGMPAGVGGMYVGATAMLREQLRVVAGMRGVGARPRAQRVVRRDVVNDPGADPPAEFRIVSQPVSN